MRKNGWSLASHAHVAPDALPGERSEAEAGESKGRRQVDENAPNYRTDGRCGKQDQPKGICAVIALRYNM